MEQLKSFESTLLPFQDDQSRSKIVSNYQDTLMGTEHTEEKIENNWIKLKVKNV